VPQTDDASLYRAYVRQFDEETSADDLCDADELSRLRQQLDQQLSTCKASVSKLATACSGGSSRSSSAPGSSTWRRGCSTCAASRASSPTRCSRCPTSGSGRPDFRDTVVSLLIDNSGSMRGADHRGRHVLDILRRTWSAAR
jgi:cobaltochelatase CobT